MGQSKVNLKEKFRASAIHLGLSALVAALALTLFVAWWFPMPYFVTDGGAKGITLLLAVDVIIGPILTFVAFSSAKPKKELVKDLAVIGLLQLAALTGGLYAISSKRIAANIYADGYFYPLDANTAFSLGDATTALITASPKSPAYLWVDLPDDVNARQKFRAESVKSGLPIYGLTELMKPFDKLDKAEIEATYEEPKKRVEPKDAEKLAELSKKLSKPPENYYFIPAVGKNENYFLLVNRETLKVESYLRGLSVR